MPETSLISSAKARAVMQGVLDKLTQAIWEDNPHLMMQHTTNPHWIYTKEGPTTFNHDAKLGEALHTLHRSIHNMKVTNYVRSVVDAHFLGPDEIEGQYRSWFLNGTLDVYPSFNAHMVLVRKGDRFVMQEVRNHISRAAWPLLAPDDIPRPTPPPVAFSQGDFDAFLEDITQPFLTRDITRWENRIRLPFSLITREGPTMLRTPQEVMQNFQYYLQACDVMGLDQIIRQPVGFEVCDDFSIIATYRTEFLREGQQVIPPYTSSALLHHTPEGWQMSSILNGMGHQRWTGTTNNASGEKS
ncbi:hypothetical protein [Tropicibacter naphthalenivorans]|uniref:Uncharacterized protein n=1 Tax=Tropicibacter naphthalenivorans TaxID=441103 RepID=A0A0P1GH10_9RHOB|nr:hypothetical protein [Tropicibacter naphthalenivorans]CUH80908.1 hypothetical protein TRN7648_03226 [Tropicibacter naphthalenivorans]SMC91034.1 hypothetical protein SAMN04488093_106198 [Tropicibacter naphthalenivorans]